MNKKRMKLMWALPVIIAVLFATRLKHSNSEELSEPVKKGPIMESVYGIGTVTANKTFQLKTGVTATIRRLFVKEGDQVKGGQRLVVLDSNISFAAPFDGTIVSAPVKVGENVFAQTTILELVDLLDRTVIVSLEQRAAVRVHRGQKAKLSFENLRELSYEGVVESVYSQGSDFLVRIDAPNLPPQILPGMTADVAIAISEHADALLVPAAAVQNGMVSIKRGGKRLNDVPVTIGLVDGALAQVTAGDIQEGDQLVISKKSKP